jgi:hypothetical protein
MRFFPKGLHPFKIQSNFKLGFASEFYNSKSRENWKLDQKGILFKLKVSSTVRNLEKFGDEKDCICNFKLRHLKVNWKIFQDFERKLSGPGPR